MPISSFVADGKMLTLSQLMEKEGIVSVSMPGSANGDNMAVEIDRGIVDYSHLSYEKAVQEEARWLNNNGVEKGHEFGSLLSHDRRILGTWEGTENRIDIDRQEFLKAIRGIAPKGVDFIHCHLDSTLFSDRDMNTMCRIKEIDKVMISLPNNDVYYLSVNNGQRPGKNTLQMTWDYLYFSNEREARSHLNVEELLQSQRADVIMKVTEKMADMFDWGWGKYE
jgi:hypothetical protein